MGSKAGWRTKNITYNSRDTKNLKYGPNWHHGVPWNASNVCQTGTLSFSNDLNATVTFNFPMPAVAFHYFGMLRSNGGLYGICVDCDQKKPKFQNVDAFNITDYSKNPPFALFSQRFDTPAHHVVTLRNQIDPRGVPIGKSQITIVRFVLEVVDDSPLTTSLPTTSPFTILPSTSSSLVPVPVSSLLPSSASGSVETGPPVGVIIGGAIGGSLLMVIMIVTVLYCLHRRKCQIVSSAHDDISTDIGEASFPIVVPYTLMHPSIPKEERPKAGESRRTPQRVHRPTSSSGTASIVAYYRSQRRERQPKIGVRRRRERRREIGARRRPERREADTGMIPLEDERGTLPLYEQVLQAGPSSRLPSGQEPDV
ncbi:hypothetical protein PM082_003578 [Marasmius tenuissimus]|nr:hypothetical protein PM082_003578 [Marasmius tenuissimus]